MNSHRRKVLLGMSGGVDSSVAAHILQRQGYDVTGVFLCLGGLLGPGHDTTGCCSPQDAADARRVAQLLGIELYVLNAADAFGDIVDYFVDEYVSGRTPNPCIHCNARIKFARLLQRADELGAEFIATGHYARVRDGGICRAAAKDQSYALFELPRAMLGRVLLPIGEIPDKAEIRRIAESLRLPVADKPDSQEICFVSGNYVELLRQRRPAAFRPGEIVDSSGNVLGPHEGVAAFTIGQRRSLGPGIEDAVHRIHGPVPMYVTKIDPANARVTVGPKEETFARRLTARDANWHIDPPPSGWEFHGTVQIRYNHAAAAKVTVLEAGRFAAEFDQPVSAITPGQGAAIYDGPRLLGGGWIE